ncbi:hypothetical protein [Azospirillum sp. SYSU D00513]|uniref:cell division protein FtsX n=1 Tax=Azospirillum sp. SYSU D00513 TaxID=2812561 RepID=UPI001A96F6B8|nr:hypothetical protein [Azospirillum sp. SYSU D00513]
MKTNGASLFRRRFDLPLARDATGRFLTWITALMVYLAALALAGTLLVSDMAGRWDRGLAGGLTVQVAPLAEAGAASLEERVETAVKVLSATPGVTAATTLTPEDTARLLEPWLGPAAADPLLPMPRLIDVVTDGTVDTRALDERLGAEAPGSTLDDHAVWLSDLRAFASALQIAALGIVLLIGGAAVVAVVFAVRSGLAIHRHVVELLHLMGATDRYVARQFEAHVMNLTLKGGLLGLGLAAATLAGIHHASAGLRAGLLPDTALAPWQWLTLAAVPAAACLLAVVTARWTVLRTLVTLP